MAPSLSPSPIGWQRFRETIDQKLADALAKHLSALPLSEDPFLKELFHHVQALAKEGKRLRPYIASLAFEAAGGDPEQAPWDAWIGIELIHLFALIHDDVIDQGAVRHNTETIQTFAFRRLQELDRNTRNLRIGDSQAILVGDLVYTWAHKHLSRAILTSGHTEEPSRIVFELLEEVIVGQSLDIDLTTRTSEPYETIERKMLLKTARYTFSRPMQLGAAFSGAVSEELSRFFQEFGDTLGLAFQLQDDWFDLISTEQRTGKTGFRDLEEGQQTFFTHFVFKEGTRAQQERLSRLFGYPLTKEQREEAYTLFTEVGAIKNGERLIEHYFQEAERILQQALFLPEAQAQTFQSLLQFLKTRSA